MNNAQHTKFYRDKRNGKVAGVCAGVADYIGMDVTVVRIGMLIATFATGGATVPLYILSAWVAPKKPLELEVESLEKKKFWQGVRANPARTARQLRSSLRSIDRRLADVETYVTSSNSRLAREIEQLR